jgi:hypothetical protein
MGSGTSAGSAEIELRPVPARSVSAGRLSIATIAALCGIVMLVDLDIRRPQFESEQPDIYVGDGRRYEVLGKAAGLRLRTLAERIMETAAFLKETQ